MTITQFRYVIEIVKTGSMNAAARNLFVSQSALSSAIQKLEEELGYKIFQRSTKGTTLTTFGEEFYSCIKPINMQIKHLEDMSKRSKKHYTFSLSVASLGFYFLSEVLSKLYSKYKSIGIYINSYEGSIDDVINLVYDGTCEFGLLRVWAPYKSIIVNQCNAMKLSFHSIATLDIGITIGENNPLFYCENDFITKEQIKDMPSIMYPYMAHGPYSNVYTLLDLPIPKNKIVTQSRAMIYETLNTTDAYLLNSLYFPNNEIPQIDSTYRHRTLKLRDCDVKSVIGWVAPENSSLSLVALETISLISEYLSRPLSI